MFSEFCSLLRTHLCLHFPYSMAATISHPKGVSFRHDSFSNITASNLLEILENTFDDQVMFGNLLLLVFSITLSPVFKKTTNILLKCRPHGTEQSFITWNQKSCRNIIIMSESPTPKPWLTFMSL